MGGFNWAWFIAVGIGFALVGIDYRMTKAQRQKFGRLLLILAAAFIVVGLAGIGRDAYTKLKEKSASTPVQSNSPQAEKMIPVIPGQEPSVQEPKRLPKSRKTTPKQMLPVPSPQRIITAPNGVGAT